MKLPQLKALVVQSGLYLGTRHIVGMLLSVIGMLLILRQLGPHSYGLVAVAQGIWGYLSASNLCALGLNIFLIRRPGELSERVVQQIFWAITILSTLISLIMIIIAPWIAQGVSEPRITDVFRFLAIGFFIRQLSLTSLSLLERDLRYREVSLMELAGQLIYYVIAVPLVFMGWDYWAIVVGWLGSGVLIAGWAFRCRPISLKWAWDSRLMKEALSYGISYNISHWLWQLRELTVPLFVSRLAGVEVVGVINAARQFAERLGFFRHVFWRISLSGIAKIQDDPDAVQQGVVEGMRWQLLLTGPLLALFSCVSTWLMPALLGPAWKSISVIFPFIACGLLINGLFSLACSALFAKGYNNQVSQFHIAHVATLWIATIALTPWLKIWGYGLAELVALWSYIVVHVKFKTFYNQLDYSGVKILLLATLLPLFLGPWLSPIGGIMIWLAVFGLAWVLDRDLRTNLLDVMSSLKVSFEK